MTLEETYEAAAAQCEADGVALDDTPGGAIHEWVMQNVQHRPGTAFFIVLGIACAMADRSARREGFASSADKAAAMVRQYGSRAAAGLPAEPVSIPMESLASGF